MNQTEKIEKGLVTIVVPAYNVERFIGENVESVLNQTYKELEIIYVCDGCTDHTAEILQKYAEKDYRMTVRVETENQGAAISRNIGMNMSTGDWIVFLDADDLIEFSMIEELLEAAVCAQAEMACCYLERFEDVPNREASIDFEIGRKKLYCKTYPIIETEKESNCIIQAMEKGPCTKLVHKSVYMKKEVFFQDIPNANDAYYSIVVAINTNRIVYVDKVLYHYRINKGRTSLTTDRTERKNYILEACDKIFKYIKGINNERLLYSFYNDVLWNLYVYCETNIYPEIFKSIRDVYLEAWGMRQGDISSRLYDINRVIYRNVLKGNIENNRKKMLMEAKIEFVRETAKRGCAIWGMGLMGTKLLEAIVGMDIKIEHVYDSDRNKWGTTVAGFLIEKPVHIETNNIIVTARKYFDDIKAQINDNSKNIYNLEEQIWLMPCKESCL